jgi:hypothetical protein
MALFCHISKVSPALTIVRWLLARPHFTPASRTPTKDVSVSLINSGITIHLHLLKTEAQKVRPEESMHPLRIHRGIIIGATHPGFGPSVGSGHPKSPRRICSRHRDGSHSGWLISWDSVDSSAFLFLSLATKRSGPTMRSFPASDLAVLSVEWTGYIPEFLNQLHFFMLGVAQLNRYSALNLGAFPENLLAETHVENGKGLRRQIDSTNEVAVCPPSTMWYRGFGGVPAARHGSTSRAYDVWGFLICRYAFSRLNFKPTSLIAVFRHWREDLRICFFYVQVRFHAASICSPIDSTGGHSFLHIVLRTTHRRNGRLKCLG